MNQPDSAHSARTTTGHDHAHDHDHEHHAHSHGHTHGHSHAPKDFGRAFALGVLLNGGFVVAEAVYGVLANSMALRAVPQGVDATAVRAYLAGIEGVDEVHDLHIWGMSTTETALTAHLVMPGGYPDDAFRTRMNQALQQKFAIAHATIQIELGEAHAPCALAPQNIV